MSNIAAIEATVRWADPEGACVLIGGAAVVAQMKEAGLDCDPTPDVDTIAPAEFYGAIRNKVWLPLNVAHAGPLYWQGWRERGSIVRAVVNESMVLEPKPGIVQVERMSFTTSQYMENHYILDSETFNGQPMRTVVAQGLRCLALGQVLFMKAAAGRDKDLVTIGRVWDPALRAGLIDGVEAGQVVDMIFSERDRDFAGRLRRAIPKKEL